MKIITNAADHFFAHIIWYSIASIVVFHLFSGWNDYMDIAVYVVVGIVQACFLLSLMSGIWKYARDTKSRTPYRQMANFICFLLIFIFVSVPVAFVAQFLK